jgi:hypothetical protein
MEDMETSTTGEPFEARTPGTLREEVFRGNSGRSASGLLRDLVNDVALLFQKELALAASEITQSVHEARRGVTGMVSGGAVLYAGLLFLLAAACFGLARVMPAWAATLIVGAVVALIGYIMVAAGRKRLEPTTLVPERAMESMRKDREAIRRQTS